MNWERFNTSTSFALLRLSLFCINMIFLVTGGILIFIGFLVRDEMKNLPEVSPDLQQSPSNILLGFGLTVFVVGLSAFWCTIKGHGKLLYIYSILILLIFIGEIFLAVNFLMQKQEYETAFKKTFKKIMHEYPAKPANLYVDRLERMLSCCGIDSYTDWFGTPYGATLRQVPESCCKQSLNHTCVRTTLEKDKLPTDVNTNGCYTTIITTIKNNYPLFGGIIISIALVPLVGIVLAICLANQIRKHRYQPVE